MKCNLLYLPNVKSLSKYIGGLYDFIDESIISETKVFLECIIKIRNNLCHFEKVFKEGLCIEELRQEFFSNLKNLTGEMQLLESIIDLLENAIPHDVENDDITDGKGNPETRSNEENDTIQNDVENDDITDGKGNPETRSNDENDTKTKSGDIDGHTDCVENPLLDEYEIIKEFKNYDDAHSEQAVSTIGDILNFINI